MMSAQGNPRASGGPQLIMFRISISDDSRHSDKVPQPLLHCRGHAQYSRADATTSDAAAHRTHDKPIVR